MMVESNLHQLIIPTITHADLYTVLSVESNLHQLIIPTIAISAILFITMSKVIFIN